MCAQFSCRSKINAPRPASRTVPCVPTRASVSAAVHVKGKHLARDLDVLGAVRVYGARGRRRRLLSGLAIPVALPVALVPGEIAAVISYGLDDSQSFCSPLAEQQTVTGSEVLWPLDEFEGHRGPVTCSDEWPVHVDDGACLADGADVQHRLVLLLDSCGVAEDQHLGDEFVVHPRRRGAVGWLRQYHHALSDVFPLDFLQCEGSALTGAGCRYRNSFPLDGANGAWSELAQAVGPDDNAVTGVDDTGLDDAGDNGPNKRHGESVIDVEFKWGISIVSTMSVSMLKFKWDLEADSPSVVRQDVQERPY